ncbi:hypothetical protein [Candidatus Coxiella mudrowiae]|uniref:hypothetical protein n=1 Tax=Candidatus Coxiella mudrowiae TaxID=2054173 RepID=UPI000C28630D|nr:hypothetical protein [Candidatus Coxiella mudrowiae]
MKGNLGYTLPDWKENLPYQVFVGIIQGGAPPFGDFKNGKDGFTAGFTLGYQWNRFIAAEISWNHLPKMRYFVPHPWIVSPTGGNY